MNSCAVAVVDEAPIASRAGGHAIHRYHTMLHSIFNNAVRDQLIARTDHRVLQPLPQGQQYNTPH
jgi:hypothetical protein